MIYPVKSNAALVEENNADSDAGEPEIVQEYKNLNAKCEAVLDKINKRKKSDKKSKNR